MEAGAVVGRIGRGFPTLHAPIALVYPHRVRARGGNLASVESCALQPGDIVARRAAYRAPLSVPEIRGGVRP